MNRKRAWSVGFAIAATAGVAALVPAQAPSPVPSPVLVSSQPGVPRVVSDQQVSVDNLPTNFVPPCAQGPQGAMDAALDKCPQPDTAVEPSIAVNPVNPANVITVFQQGRFDGPGDAGNGFAFTVNGGQTWSSGNFPGLTKAVADESCQIAPSNHPCFDRSSDAMVTFGPEGIAYAVGDAFNTVPGSPNPPNGSDTGIAFWASPDGGRTWGHFEDGSFKPGQPTLITLDQVSAPPAALGTGLNDRPWLAVDQSDAPGHTRGRIYATWMRFVSGANPSAVFAAFSDDHGATWNLGPGGHGFLVESAAVYPFPAILPDGRLAITVEDAIFTPPEHGNPDDNAAELEALQNVGPNCVRCQPVGLLIADAPGPANNNTLAFGNRHTVAFNLAVNPGSITGECSPQPCTKPEKGLRAGAFEAPLVVDPPRGPRTTPRIFFAWPDGRLRTKSPTVSPPGQRCGDGLNDILITHSDDFGVTWSAPVAVNPAECGKNHLGPMLGVTSEGRAVVGYITHDDPPRPDPGGTTVGTSVQVSADDGLTFSPPASVTLANSDLRFGAITDLATRVMLGEYDQLAIAGNMAYLARPEPLNLNLPSETADFTFHHERIWVAKVVLPRG